MYKEQLRSKAWDSTIRKTQLQRRGCSLFTTSSVAPLDDNTSSSPETDHDTDTADACFVERLLPSGDFYTGLWSVDRPHGTGKYLWMDGCMYEGEWYNGKTKGKGKFSWPSGATYEGEFSSGFLDGFGNFTGASGDTYKGYYSMNLKHGQGTRIYTNGDCYEGEWRCGLQDGQGKYIWKNGHEYNGGWKDGVMSGKGVLIWANGNCFDGDWGDGLPSGKGEFRWPDGSRYVGVWSKDPSVKKGVFFPSAGNVQLDPQDALAIDLDECRICSGENFLILPSQKTVSFSPEDEAEQRSGTKNPYKVMDAPKLTRKCSVVSSQHGRRERNRSNAGNSNGTTGTERCFDRICIWEADGDITCDIVDANAVVAAGRKLTTQDGNVNPRLSDADPKFGRSPLARLVPRDFKKQGVTISKGHKNYDLMLNLQLGIRHAVGRPAPAISLDLKSSAFDPKEKIWTKFPPEGSKSTPPHQSCEFKWKDYCPVVFRALRKLFNVDAADYMISICGNDALRELSSPGKSGSFFYLTHDDRYMIKTIKKAEAKVLLRMLPAYYRHVRSFDNTLVTKFFGLHCVKLTGAIQKKVRFVIMGNLFCSEYIIHRRFDLKGSSHGRITDKPESEIDANTTLKDLDLNFLFRLQRSWFQEFTRQVDKDCEFLEQERIMDYSLLVGLHFRETSSASEQFFSEGSSDTSSEGTHLSRSDTDHLLFDPNRRASIKLGVSMPAQVEQTVRKSNSDSQLVGEPTGEFYDVMLFFGIIDILQDYDISKKLEHAYKSFQYDATSISAVDPRMYAKRFRDFIFKVFREDT